MMPETGSSLAASPIIPPDAAHSVSSLGDTLQAIGLPEEHDVFGSAHQMGFAPVVASGWGEDWRITLTLEKCAIASPDPSFAIAFIMLLCIFGHAGLLGIDTGGALGADNPCRSAVQRKLRTKMPLTHHAPFSLR